MYEYKAKIISVYDGDTVTAVIDLGMHVGRSWKIYRKTQWKTS